MRQRLTMTAQILLAVAFLGLGAGGAGALETIKVSKDIYALVGPLEQRSAQNLGNNATFGVIVTSEGVVLVDPGGSAQGAAAIEAAISKITDKSVRVVINTGGQDHRWFGNAYFKAKGARIIASKAAVADQKERTDLQWQIMERLISKEKLSGTELVSAGTTFDAKYGLTFGGVKIQIVHAGQAHTPGDAFVWLPEQKILFSGDIIYLDRLLGVSDHSNSKSWLSVFAEIEKLKPMLIVPGHGRPAPLQKAQKDTRDYLLRLRKEIGAVIAAGGTMIESVKVDQSPFKELAVFKQLAGRNAQAVFAEMEFD